MTTKIHVVNYGPEAVEASTTNSVGKIRIYAQESKDFYVYDDQEVKITELKTKSGD